jgi:hypothetical protein
MTDTMQIQVKYLEEKWKEYEENKDKNKGNRMLTKWKTMELVNTTFPSIGPLLEDLTHCPYSYTISRELMLCIKDIVHLYEENYMPYDCALNSVKNLNVTKDRLKKYMYYRENFLKNIFEKSPSTNKIPTDLFAHIVSFVI